MKIIAKIIALTLVVLLLLIPFHVQASTISINQITKQGTPINSEDGMLTKEIIDLKEKEITIKLNLSINDKKIISSDSEILFLMDNSSSMQTMLEDKTTTRKAKIVSSTKELINKINQNNPNVKMGMMSFSTSTQVIQDFTNDKNALLNASDNFMSQAYTGSTNMASGLSKAKEKFTPNVKNKILILLTDGMPSDGANATKTQLQAENIYIMSVLVGLEESKQAQISEIFGTEENPTADKLYNIADHDIETVISSHIYEKILEDYQASVSDIMVKDYFPKEIIENFDIVVNEPTKGQKKQENDAIVWLIDSLNPKQDATLTYTLKLKDTYDSNLKDAILNTNQRVELKYTSMLGNQENKEMTDSPQIQIISNIEEEKKDEPEKTPEENNKNNGQEKESEITNKSEKVKNTITIKNNDNTVKKEENDNYAKTELPFTGNSKMIFLPIGLIIVRLIILRRKIKSI